MPDDRLPQAGNQPLPDVLLVLGSAMDNVKVAVENRGSGRTRRLLTQKEMGKIHTPRQLGLYTYNALQRYIQARCHL